jgi:hypothetical protein
MTLGTETGMNHPLIYMNDGLISVSGAVPNVCQYPAVKRLLLRQYYFISTEEIAE